MRRSTHQRTFKDPVCHMRVSRSTAAAAVEYGGKIYYFCAPSCRDEFERAPERYIGKWPSRLWTSQARA